MNNKDRIDFLFILMTNEVYDFIHNDPDVWVPAARIKRELGLVKNCYPKSSKTQGEKGWIFATLVSHLEDTGRIVHKLENRAAFYRVAK